MRLFLCLAVLSLGDSFLQPNLSHQVSSFTDRGTPGTLQSCDYIGGRGESQTCISSTISSNEELKPGIAAIDAANPSLFRRLSQLRDNPYFRLYSVDILASCEYMPQELFECYSETCEIYPVDEVEVRQAHAHSRSKQQALSRS